LGTDSKQVARAKLARLLTEELPASEAGRGELFQEAAHRVADAQSTAGRRSWKGELARLEQHVLPILGPMPAKAIRARHINELLQAVTVTDRRTGKQTAPSRQTLKNILSDITVILDDLWRAETLPENVARRVRLPQNKRQAKERAVLTDEELAIYLQWEHPDELARVAVLQRQTMACISRLFGGVRTGDLHAMRWEHFDADRGHFNWGYAPRAKTKSPQRLGIDAMLRPIIHRWWSHSGEPTEGLIFPALRDGKNVKAGRDAKVGISHAEALRRDLRRAFGVDRLETVDIKQKNGRTIASHQWIEVRKMTAREVELFIGTDHMAPVDFHSGRRAYCQALANAGVNAQLAKALAGHATEAAHEKYLRSSETARELPALARPLVDLSMGLLPSNQVSATERSET
jgi:integrase